MKPEPSARCWRAAIFPLALLALNFYFSKELFTLEYSQFMGSIEASFISISRYMIDNWRDLTWYPLWYGGIPFQNTYPPLLHAIVALSAVALHISPAQAHHGVTAFFYCLGPIALYALALRLTGSRWCGFWIGLVYSIVAPSYFLMPSVRAAMGGDFSLRRLHVLVVYGEGPHIASVAMLPLAILFLDSALSKGHARRYILAAAMLTAIVLSNWIGALALAIAVFAYLLARSGSEGLLRFWLQATGIGALAYALACSWIPPSTIQTIRSNAQLVAGNYTQTYRKLPVYSAAGIFLALVLKWVMQRRKVAWPIQFAALFAILISALPLTWEWYGIAIVPQPYRYHIEMDLAICLATVYGLYLLIAKMQPHHQKIIAAVLLMLCVWFARLDRRHARRMIKPIDIRQTVEYQTARWFENTIHGGRVFAPGTISYWMNAFADTSQIGGGFDQGLVLPTQAMAEYQLLSGENAGAKGAEIAMIWLKAYRIQAIAVGGKPFLHAERFRDWDQAARFGETTVFWVPGQTGSLAHVVPRASTVRALPINGIDVDPLRDYVRALDDPNLPSANFHWTSRHSAEIQAILARDQVVSVQIAYHPGWHASANGQACPLRSDGLGLTVVEPKCVGPCTVQLNYDGGWEMLIARTVSWSSIVGCLIWLGISSFRKRVLS